MCRSPRTWRNWRSSSKRRSAGGLDAATGLARKQAGKQFDPKLADMVVSNPEDLLSGLDDINSWNVVIDDEPSLSRPLTEAEFDDALTAIANFVDLKSPYTLGHTTAVAELAGAAGAQLGMNRDAVRTLRRAALVIGFGRLGVSNAIWISPVRWAPANGNASACTPTSPSEC